MEVSLKSGDLINSSSDKGSENVELPKLEDEPSENNFLPTECDDEEDKLNGEIQGNDGDVGIKDGQILLPTDDGKDLIENTSTSELNVEMTTSELNVEIMDNIGVPELINGDSSMQHAENGCIAVGDGTPLSNHKREGSPISTHEIGGSSISGVKRPRITFDDQQPSVRVMYNSLTRDSKLKLQELLQQWSKWHAQHCSSSQDTKGALESGEETYFPALTVGIDKPSAVSFWMDNEPTNLQIKEFIPLDGSSVPVYDRGYTLALSSADGSSNVEGGLEKVDASRCFNCGSYNHSLKDCQRPRDNVAVNNARKQHQLKRNQSASSRNPTRYYQNSPGGKYDGLRPGALDAETRQLLGLKELDPPPWLNRMREIGYPPGYLDTEVEDEPSGITIFADEEANVVEEKEDGEILDKERPEPPKKMSIEFPGINAPIPDNADERRWATNSDLPRNRSSWRSNQPPEPRGNSFEPPPPPPPPPRWSRDRDEGPPGCDPWGSPSLVGNSPRYGSYDSPRVPISPRLDRSLSERERRSPLAGLRSPPSYGRDRGWNDFSPPPSSPYRHYDHHMHHGGGHYRR